MTSIAETTAETTVETPSTVIPDDAFAWSREALTRLCAVETTSGQEDRMLPALQLLLAEMGAAVTLQPVSPGRTNVLARWGAPQLLFSTHLDTVPPFRPPRVESAGLWARGACDAKGQIVAQLATIGRLLRAGYRNVAWLGVVGEETDAAGARQARELAPTLRGLRAVINGEPTENRLASAQLGFLQLGLRCVGRRAHPAVEGARHNALWHLTDWLHALRAVPLAVASGFGSESWNLGQVVGGDAANVVAGEARAEIAVRTVPGSTFLEDCERLAPEGARVTVRCAEPPLALATLDDFPQAPVAFGSDAPWLAELLPEFRAGRRAERWADRWDERWAARSGADSESRGRLFMFGPGSIATAHTDDEHLTWRDLASGIDTLFALAIHVLDEEDP